MPKNLVLLCRRAHDQTDAPYAKGRLVFFRGPAGLRWAVLRGASKRAAHWVEAAGVIPFGPEEAP